MAIAIIRGQRFGTFKQPDEEVTEAEDGSQVIKVRYRTVYDSWLTNVAQRGAIHPRYPRATLRDRVAKQLRPSFLCDVTLTYKAPKTEGDGSAPGPGAVLPPTRYEETNNYVEYAIQKHPNWPNWEQYWDYGRDDWILLAPTYLLGVKTYIVGSVTESETTYSWGRPTSVSEVVNQISGGGHWMVVSGAIRQEGLYWSKTLNRIYSKTPFPTQIYDNL